MPSSRRKKQLPMLRLRNLLHLFTKGQEVSCIAKENQDSFVLSATYSLLNIPDAYEFLSLLTVVPSRDKVEVGFKSESGDASLSEFTTEKCSEFLENIRRSVQLDSTISDDTENEYQLSVSITKGVENDTRTLYSLEAFTDFLVGIPLRQKLSVFRSLLAHNHVSFQVAASTEEFKTQSVDASLSPRGSGVSVARDSILQKRAEICHFGNAGEYPLIPEDFYLVKRSSNDRFNALMDGLFFIFSLVSIADIASINGDVLSVRINGYKVVSEDIPFGSIVDVKTDELFKIYTWAYEGGNISDKIGIVRNLITLYSRSGLLHMEEGIHSAAMSNFEIYLKENIGRYLDTKNTVTTKILELSQKCVSYTESFSSTFKQSVLAISSFFITIIVLAAIDKEKYGKIFTHDVKIVSGVLIAISFAHLIFTILEYNKKCDRFKDEYEYLKECYSDVLDPKDIQRIFKNDEVYRKDSKHLQDELARYSLLWMLVLCFLLIAVLTTSCS